MDGRVQIEDTAALPVRDPLALPEAVHDARRRPMQERLELALSWNAVAVELRAGLAKQISANGRVEQR